MDVATSRLIWGYLRCIFDIVPRAHYARSQVPLLPELGAILTRPSRSLSYPRYGAAHCAQVSVPPELRCLSDNAPPAHCVMAAATIALMHAHRFQFYRGYRRVGEIVGSEAVRGRVERALAAHVDGRPLGPHVSTPRASGGGGLLGTKPPPPPSPDRGSPWRRWRT